MKRIYLACPYYHKDELIKNERFALVNKKAGELMKRGYCVFSPLSHSVPIDATFEKRKMHDFWLAQDFQFVEWCDEFHIYCLPGWNESRGVKEEYALARKLDKKIVLHDVLVEA